jgi:archaemetzincin
MAAQRVVHLITLGRVPRDHLHAVAAVVHDRFGARTAIGPAVQPPAGAWNAGRLQFDADFILDSLFDRLGLDVFRIVGLTGADLYADERNYVFGYAHMRDRVAVVSTARLLTLGHLEKAVVHELGHTFHAPHCTATRCVMRQVEHLWQLDDLDDRYCAGCAARIDDVARRPVDGAESFFELAGSYMRRQRFAHAVAAFGAACERDPANAHYANDLGVAHLALGERAPAAGAFERAIALAPELPHAYYNLGIIFRERGDIPMADALFGAALARDADLRAGHRYLGILHQDYFQDPPRARAHLERYVALGGADVEVRRRLSQLARRAMHELASDSRVFLEYSTTPR